MFFSKRGVFSREPPPPPPHDIQWSTPQLVQVLFDIRLGCHTFTSNTNTMGALFLSVHWRWPSITYIHNVISQTSEHHEQGECFWCTPDDYVTSCTYRYQHLTVSDRDGISAHISSFSLTLCSSIVHIVVCSQLSQPSKNKIKTNFL